MNSQNVKAIKYITQPTNGSEPKEITEEVVFFTRLNDLRFDMPDRRRVGNDIGDGWRSENTTRHLLNEKVDDRIEQLERLGFEHTLLFEKDFAELEK